MKNIHQLQPLPSIVEAECVAALARKQSDVAFQNYTAACAALKKADATRDRAVDALRDAYLSNLQVPEAK
jgi:hypothetical protein